MDFGSQWNNGRSLLTHASNFIYTQSTRYGTQSGYVRTQFYDTHPLPATDINTGQTVHVMGLPVIGVTLMRFTNVHVQPGILAQYGFAYPLKAKKKSC